MENRITEEDYNKYQEFIKFFMKHGKWKEMGIDESIKVHSHLAFLNILNNKIKANIFEVTKIVEPEPETKPKKKTKGKK